jgi:hypothetical protein
MRLKLAGHGLQLAGFALTFLGLGAALAVIFASSTYPTIPFWAFAVGAVVVAAPLMIAGGRINKRGRGLVLDMSPEEADREYQTGNLLLFVYIVFLMMHGFIVAAPLFVRATGLVYPSDTFVKVWIYASMLTLCAGRYWITRPLWNAIAQRIAPNGKFSN